LNEKDSSDDPFSVSKSDLDDYFSVAGAENAFCGTLSNILLDSAGSTLSTSLETSVDSNGDLKISPSSSIN
jgi:hypothetical protein